MQGKTINGFELKNPLGVGGMAEVWYAENEIHKAAAVKILNYELSHNAGIVERFRNEAEIMVRLDHPNIREVYGYGVIDGRPAIVMEYLEGDDLKARIKQGQRFTQAELVKWWNQLVDALKYTHEEGIVHRDIKPGNIFIDKKGNVKLLDFGIAKVRDCISMTQTGQKLGTLMYMSPEQVRDSKHIDYHTDIYSLAVTFVHLITGKKPYDSDNISDYDIQVGIVTKPLDMDGVPEEWKRFLAPYLEKEAEKRPDLRYFEAAVKSHEKTVEKPASKNIKKFDDEATVIEAEETHPVGETLIFKHPEETENAERPKKIGIILFPLCLALFVGVMIYLFLPKGSKEYRDAKAIIEKSEKAVKDARTCDELYDVLKELASFFAPLDTKDKKDYKEEERMTIDEKEKIEKLSKELGNLFEEKFKELKCN